MIAERIKFIREQEHISQADLAKRLGITRSSVNAWELGISVPSTQYIVELATIFKVSSDFLLGLESSVSVNVSGLAESDIEFIHATIQHLRMRNKI